MVEARGHRENKLKVRQSSQHTGLRLPTEREFNILGIAQFRVKTEVDILGQGLPQFLRPQFGGILFGIIEQG
jgi:hypothetical protein